MVIVNPKLSLPTDLPYKKRQRPFNPNTSLHQATIRYNEALRKQYNDIQFAKRFENGAISQNELTSVNTVDIAKTLDPQLFSEMNDLNPLFIEPLTQSTRKRKSKKYFICSGSSISDAIATGNPSFDHNNNNSGLPSPTSNSAQIPSILSSSQNEDQKGMAMTTANNAYDCNNTEMFPQLSATMPNASAVENDKQYFSRCNANCRPPQAPQQHPLPPSSNSSLEAQAVNEYEPTADSAHDMIFGNVMGLHYGNYIHDHLWTPSGPQSHHVPLQNGPHANATSCPCQFGLPPAQPYPNSQDYPQVGLVPPPPLPDHHSQMHACGTSKSVGFNLPPTTSGPNQLMNVNFNANESQSGMMFANCSNSATAVGNNPTSGGSHNNQTQFNTAVRSSSRPRSTSVPRPRVGGTRKETLKQAAIRCGIIKGNQTVPVIPKRSHCLIPLQLSSAQSDPAVSVVEILHPRALIPTCSSEVLMEENGCYIKSKLSLNQMHAMSNHPQGINENDSNVTDASTPTKANISDEGKLLTQISSISDFRILDGASSCASF